MSSAGWDLRHIGVNSSALEYAERGGSFLVGADFGIGHPGVIVDRQYTSLVFTDALHQSGIAGSIGSVGDCLLTG
ncbi:hypothetical protein [Mycolicibacterium sp. CH28]|uniref:hypothetical protein n=1 Tax=Mycolicibacterium sp. CH28 TaxID=2512237 RepID=UPI0013A5DC77|nr:hypothetical protein [Mycolicibacterium sp. CH28]